MKTESGVNFPEYVSKVVSQASLILQGFLQTEPFLLDNHLSLGLRCEPYLIVQVKLI